MGMRVEDTLTSLINDNVAGRARLHKLLSIIKRAKKDLPECLIKGSYRFVAINAYLPAKAIIFVLSNHGKYQVNDVIEALCTIEIKKKIDSNFQYDNSEAIDLSQKIHQLILTCLNSISENQARHDDQVNKRNVRIIHKQLKDRQIGETEANKRLAKYYTSEQLKTDNQILFSNTLRQVFELLRPPLLESEIKKYAKYIPDEDFLKTLVVSGVELEILKWIRQEAKYEYMQKILL